MLKSTQFSAIDYVLFVLALLISVITGIYFAIKDRKEDTNVYFFGKGEMSPWPVGFSIAVSFVSAITVVGYPVEVYLYGTVWLWAVPAFPVIVVITCVYFIPIYHTLQLKSVYEYLELRFNKPARLLSSALNFCQMIIYMGVVVYTPSLMLTTLVPISLNWIIAMTCIVCTFYTVVGGLKSVMWTDAFQAVVMAIGSVVILILSTIQSGGTTYVFESIKRGNRTTLWDFDTNSNKRSTTWSVFFGLVFDWLILMTTNQTNVQRYLSCKSISVAKQAVLISVTPQVLITLCAMLTGMSMYAYFENCDPVSFGEIEKNDQLVALLLSKITTYVPGVKGLFVATVFCATLSTVSSGINSLTVMIMEDFVSLKWKNIQERKKLQISKWCGLLLGVLVFLLAVAVGYANGTLLELSIALLSAFGAPIMGMYILGIFIPWANTIGTIVGAIFGVCIGFWLLIGSQFLSTNNSQILPLSINQCNSSKLDIIYLNTSTVSKFSTSSMNTQFSIYSISFLYFKAISLTAVIITGTIVSLLSGKNDPNEINPHHFMPLVNNNCFPETIRNFFRFGVPKTSEYIKGEKNDQV